MIFKILAVGVVLLAVPLIALAQEGRAATCRSALETVKTNDDSPERRHAMRVLATCGADGGLVLAAELRRHRTTTYTGRLLADVHAMAEIRDAAVLDAALALAADRGATVESRIIAFKLLVAYKHPGYIAIPISSFLPDGRDKVFGAWTDSFQSEGSALPANWEDGTRALLHSLSVDVREGETIRYAGRTALSFLISEHRH